MTRRPGITFTRDQVEAWVGHPITDEQVKTLEQTLPNSTLPETIDVVAHEALGFPSPQDCLRCTDPIIKDGNGSGGSGWVHLYGPANHTAAPVQ